MTYTPEKEKPAFRRIGKGFCGSVWAVDSEGEAFALKRGDVSPDRSVINDSEMHQRIEKSYEACKKLLSLTHLNLPRYQSFVHGNDQEWWTARKARFPPQEYELKPCDTLISERILPFDRPVRNAIIDRFCPERLKEVVAGRREDEDCLVRPYLGRRTKRTSPFFSLRNNVMNVDRLESLALPLDDYAHTMAEALAVMYWHANVDANDVEFVLAPKGSHPTSESWHSEVLGEHTIWLLDFDCVKPITMDEAGIERAAQAFFRNDPYFPRPYSETQKDMLLWTNFSKHFLRASEALLGDSPLPMMMVGRLEEIGRERKQRRAENELSVKVLSLT